MSKKGFINISLLFTLLISFPAVSNKVIQKEFSKQIYTSVEETPIKPIALVLGAAAYNPHSLSPALQDRMDTALELFEAKRVNFLLLSGAPNEVEAMKNYALENGIEEGSLVLDEAGLNTEASIKNASANIKNVTIISQEYHLPRALFYAKHYGMEAIGTVADRRTYDKIKAFQQREVLANTKAFLEVVARNVVPGFLQ